MKNKFVWCLVLCMGVFGVLTLNSLMDIRILSGSLNILSSTSNGVDAIPIGVALFMEAFCSMHMSIFVLKPFSQIFFKKNYKKAFITLFVIRAVLLLVLNFVYPTVAMIDFMMVFFGGFVVVPISAFLTKTKLDHKSNQVIDEGDFDRETLNYKDLKKLDKADIGDIEVLKKALVMQYADINRAFYVRDNEKMKSLCSPGIYMDYKVKWEMYDKVEKIPKIEDVDFCNVELGSVEKHGSEIFVDLYIKYTCLDYAVDQNNNIVYGSRDQYKVFTKLLSFSKKQSSSIVTVCPNCGASVSGDTEVCAYCNTTLNFKIGEWILKKEKTLYEGIKK